MVESPVLWVNHGQIDGQEDDPANDSEDADTNGNKAEDVGSLGVATLLFPQGYHWRDGLRKKEKQERYVK